MTGFMASTYPRSPASAIFRLPAVDFIPWDYILIAVPPSEGVLMRRMRAGRDAAPAGPASSAGLPGGLGSPSVPTTWGCLRWLDAGRTNGAKAPGSGGRRVRRPTPEARSRSPKSRGEAPKGAPARVMGRRPGRFRDRPGREAGHGCGDPHQRLSALHPLGLCPRGKACPREGGEE